MQVRITHRIRRQHWVVKTASQDQAFAVRKLLNDRWEDTFLPAFSRAFDEGKTGAIVVRIPRLELSIKVDSIEQLTSLLPDLIFNLVRKQLPIGLNALQQKEFHRVPTDPTARRAIIGGPRAPEIREPQPRTALTEEEDWFEILIHYLKTGDLRWDQRFLDRAIVIKKLIDTSDHQRCRVFDRIIDAAPNHLTSICSRWFQLMSEEDWPLLASLLSSRESPARKFAVVDTIR